MKKSFKIVAILFVSIFTLMICGCDPDAEKVYTVKFMADNEVVKTVKVKENEKVVKIDDPIVEGKTFEYWTLDDEKFDFETPITKNITLTAKYIAAKKCTVQLIIYDGDVEEVEVEFGSSIEKIIPNLFENYENICWITSDGEIFDLNTKITGNMFLIGVYEKDKYMVTYVGVGENGEKFSLEVEKNGLAPKLKAPEIEGKTFLYWTLDGENEYDFNTPVKWDLTLYAKYESNSNQIIIKYWHANGAQLTSVLEEIKEDFEAKYEGKYRVDLTAYGDYQTLRDTITAFIAIGDTPTAAQTYPDHVALYLEGNALASLDKYINDPVNGMSKEEQAQFIEGFWAEGVIYDEAGTRYAMPFNKSTEVMYYNKDMFEKYGWNVPTTWDEVIDICEKFKQTEEYKNTYLKYDGLVYGFGYDSEANLFITLTQQYGATYTSFDANGKGVFNAFGGNTNDTVKSKLALSWYHQQYQMKNMATSTGFGGMYCSDAFKNGQCIMTIGSSAGSSYNNGLSSTQLKFTTGVAPIPQKDAKNGQVIQQGTNVSLFNCADPEEELGGWLWLKHMVSYESALKWATKTSYLPIRKDVIRSKAFQNYINGIYTDEWGDQIQGIISLEVLTKCVAVSQQDWFYTNIAFPGSYKARDKAETLVQRLLYGTDMPTIDQVYQETYDSLRYN